MTSQEVKKYELPDEPGVYFFKRGKKILYIGKATSLKDRVRSYFAGDLGETRGPKIAAMLELANRLEWQTTDSVLEALLLETALIKKHQPKYNSREKDDKSYWQIVITKEDFPKILQVRGKDLEANEANVANGAIYGPFPNGGELKEALKIIRKIFPYRDKCVPNSSKACFNRQLGLCPGVCTGEISKTEYAKTVRNLKLFFAGQKGAVVKNLEREMKHLAKLKDFERAAKVRDQTFALNHIRDVALITKGHSVSSNFRIEAYDIAHTSGQEVVGVMTVVENGEVNKNEYRKFKLSQDKNNDVGNLQEIISRRLNHPEWPRPDLVVVDGGRAQLNGTRKVLAAAGVDWPVVAVTKGEHHRPRGFVGKATGKHESEILLANAEAHRFAIVWHRQRRDRML